MTEIDKENVCQHHSGIATKIKTMCRVEDTAKDEMIDMWNTLKTKMSTKIFMWIIGLLMLGFVGFAGTIFTMQFSTASLLTETSRQVSALTESQKSLGKLLDRHIVIQDRHDDEDGAWMTHFDDELRGHDHKP